MNESTTNARIYDCELLVEYLTPRVKATVDAGVSNTFHEQDQLELIEFFETMTDKQMAYISKYAYLLRD